MKRIIIAGMFALGLCATALASHHAQAAAWAGTGWWPVGTYSNYTGSSGRGVVFGVGAPIVAANEVLSTNDTNDTWFRATSICSDGNQNWGNLAYGAVKFTNVNSIVYCPSGTVLVWGGSAVYEP